MKTAKIALVALSLLVMAPAATAQVHKSKSYIKKTTVIKEKKLDTSAWPKWIWYGRAGANIPFNGDSQISVGTGFDLDFGFQRRMGKHGWYWGMDVALNTKSIAIKDFTLTDGTKVKGDKSDIGVGGRFGLINFGWRYHKNDFWTDLHLGLGFKVGEARKAWNFVEDDGAIARVELQKASPNLTLGLGFRYKRIMADITFQPVSCFYDTRKYELQYDYYHRPSYDVSWGRDGGDHSILISVGYVLHQSKTYPAPID